MAAFRYRLLPGPSELANCYERTEKGSRSKVALLLYSYCGLCDVLTSPSTLLNEGKPYPISVI